LYSLCDITREGQLGKPEIQKLGMPTLGDEYVGGLKVAVDDTFRVGAVEPELEGRDLVEAIPSAGTNV
jgi:hypothetical protein